jgi:hypothetical protein
MDPDADELTIKRLKKRKLHLQGLHRADRVRADPDEP